MEKDFKSNVFFSDNERFADIINGIGFDGVSLVRGKDLQELDTTVHLGRRKNLNEEEEEQHTYHRDLMRKTPFGVNFAIIGIENQEEIDYAMPLRIMGYDFGEYEKQAAQIKKEVRKKKRGLSAGEFLYGFRKKDKILPTVTFVLYYGEKEWDGAKDLYGLLDFRGIPESLKSKISNYQMHVVEVRKLEDTSIFKTDVRMVFDFIRYAKDKKKLKELVESNSLLYQYIDEEAYDMVAAYAGDSEMFDWKEKYKRGRKEENKTDEPMKAAVEKEYRIILYQKYNL